MHKQISGLHHVTALASDPQRNLDFYTGVLGLRLVKKTINFDLPEVYHLYYGDYKGNPGTILTFFPFPNMHKGRKGQGQLTVISFSIEEKALSFWIERLMQYQIPFEGPYKRFGKEAYLYFHDPDGLGLELVANREEKRRGYGHGNIPEGLSIKGLYGVALCEEGYEDTARLLTEHLGHHIVSQEGSRYRYASQAEYPNYVDIICIPDALKGMSGSGTVHHVAFAAPSDEMQLQVHAKLARAGLNVTPVLDRSYFRSIYFREHGGVLFEVATKLPGFALDEPLEHLGELLKLPGWAEPMRHQIEETLPILYDRRAA